MFDHVFNKDRELYKMVADHPKIRKSLMNFVYRVINMIHSEQYDPTTVKFEAMAPAGEPNRIVLMLRAAEYSTKPYYDPVILPADASYKLVSFVDSLYKAIIGANANVEGFFHACPDLASFTYVVANRMLEYCYHWRQKDFSNTIVWDIYDHWETGDLMISGYIPNGPC